MGVTTIQWTDRTWNPVTGCTKVSEGCRHCYAEKVADRFWKDRKFTDVRCHPDRIDQPLKWRKPSRVFVNSMADLFHESVPFEFIDKVFAVMALTPQHTYQILTKRPERMREYLAERLPTTRWMDYARSYRPEIPTEAFNTKPLPNVWLGVSVENQEYADQRIPLLLRTPAAVRFISYEPALGPIDIEPELMGATSCGRPDWVIIGGESGHGARPFNVQWARDVIRQCRAAGVACFVKQMGSKVQCRNDQVADVWHYADGSDMDTVEGPRHPEYQYQGGSVTLKLLDRKGGDMAEWPEDLRVREYPK